MSKGEFIRRRGKVLEAYPNSMFKVKLEDGGETLCHISGRIRKNYIKILPGDTVTVEFSPYDLEHGRIIYRERE
ncbi:MAG: translation initiation factor IF-1 [Candidatus Bipolaricaulota bacterium]|nr:translation initiation factor IF-1 [Candidatus Bipolaricaulota bacterium]MDW8140698.1 translation initiation factor IF-1 [Candidatus Bipolaricaulota bacterium]